MTKQGRRRHPVRATTSIGTAPGCTPGFGNDFETEALPQGQNSPQKCSYGLYAEQLSGTPFTAPTVENERSWCCRIRPSVRHTGRFSRIEMPLWKGAPCIDDHIQPPGQYRWDPITLPGEAQAFIMGMRTMTTAGDVNTQAGLAVHTISGPTKNEYGSLPELSRGGWGEGDGCRVGFSECTGRILPAVEEPERSKLVTSRA
ncbi:MAG: homogentisate 1,2-dioxygenase [Paracoccaceae bacterium]